MTVPLGTLSFFGPLHLATMLNLIASITSPAHAANPASCQDPTIYAAATAKNLVLPQLVDLTKSGALNALLATTKKIAA